MLFGVSVILFAIMRLAPGGPEAVLIGGELSPDVAAQVRARLGLDRPLLAQYASWVLAALHGDLGRSFKTGDPVAALVADRLGPTLTLTGGALVLALVVAVPLGVLAAIRRNTVWDALASTVSLFGVSFPSFWLGIMLILLFSKLLMADAPYVFLYFPQQVYVTRQGYEGFVPIPTYGGIYQSFKAVRWTGK